MKNNNLDQTTSMKSNSFIGAKTADHLETNAGFQPMKIAAAVVVSLNIAAINSANAQSQLVYSTDGASGVAPHVSSSNTVAIGFGTTTGTLGGSNTYVGSNAGSNVTGTTNVFVGINAGSGVTGSGNVAIGANSVTALSDFTAPTIDTTVTIGAVTVAETTSAAGGEVSLGSVGGERLLTNVADGQITATSTNAVNGAQVFTAVSSLDSSITVNSANIATNTAQIAALASGAGVAGVSTNSANISINSANISINSANIATNATNIGVNAANIRTNASGISSNAANISANAAGVASNKAAVEDLKKESRGGIASLAALSSTTGPALAPGESGAGIGVGYFQGESAVGFDYTRRLQGKDGEGRTYIQFGLGTNMDEVVYRAGVSWKFRKKNGGQ
ncbi:MAG: hypothetical protein GKR96_12390 [Gammaproteobacteria bacterium]|nr:hypothetical protein [Gammaproteobacteria bacterium]